MNLFILQNLAKFSESLGLEILSIVGVLEIRQKVREISLELKRILIKGYPISHCRP